MEAKPARVRSKILDSCSRIACHSKQITLASQEELEVISKNIQSSIKPYSTQTWKSHPLHPKPTTPRETINYIFLLDLMNFSFFSSSDELFTVSYNNELYTGYWSLCAALNRSIDSGFIITDPKVMKDLTREQLTKVFKSETEENISFFDERLRMIRDAGVVLCEKFNGTFESIIQQSNHSTTDLISTVIANFPSFNDIAYHSSSSEPVYFYKRVQILVADIWACFDGIGPGFFLDIDDITMFADYRVPQALVFLGLFKYSSVLLDKLEKGTIDKDDEIEIRSACIVSVDRVVKEMRKNGGKINDVLVDFWLWDLAKENHKEMEHVPIHKIRTIFY